MTSDNDLRRAAHINAKKLVPSDRAALREKVARAIMKAWVNGRSTPDDFVSNATDAAIDAALEEAARVCDAYAEKDWARGEGFRNRAALDLAAAIREMKSSPGSGS
jgi:hypothetical protein